MRFIFICCLVGYINFCNTARAQIFDASSETSNQVDNGLIDTITSRTSVAPDKSQTPKPAPTEAPKPEEESKKAKEVLRSISPWTPLAISPVARLSSNPAYAQTESVNEGQSPASVDVGTTPSPSNSGSTPVPGVNRVPASASVASANGSQWRAGEYSGFRPPGYPSSQIYSHPLKLVSVITQQTFNAKNDFVPGMGDTATYLSQVGLDLTTPYATDIQPYLNYQYAERKLNGMEDFRDNSYGSAITISQKIFPFAPVFHGTPLKSEPGATYNLRGLTDDEKERLAHGDDVADIHPNFDTKLAFAFVYGDNNQETYTKHHNWAYLTQDVYSLSPSLNFDFYLKRLYNDPASRFIPNSVTISPAYNDQIVSSADGTSGSSGIFSVQEKNTWVVTLQPPPPSKSPTESGTRLDASPSQYLSIIESNAILHDTNEEPLQPPHSPGLYQNWAKFSLALQYTMDKAVSAKIEYTYEGLNALYEANNVVLSINLPLPDKIKN